MASWVRTVLLFLPVLLSCGQARCVDEVNAALREAAGDGRPVLLLVRNPRDVATLDAAHWMSETSEVAGALNGVHSVTVWNDDKSLYRFPQFRGGGLYLLSAQGRLIAQVPVPDLRDQLKASLEQTLAERTPLDELAARAEAGQAGDETVRRAWQRLVDAGETDRAVRLLAKPGNNALAQTLSTEVDLALRQRLQQLRAALVAQGAGEDPGRTMMHGMLDERMDESTALRCVGLLTEAVVRWGDDEDFRLLLKKIDRDSPRGRAATRAALRAGEVVAGRQGSSQAKDWWKLAERAAGNGESPVLLRAAVRQRWVTDGKDSPLRSRWRKREMLDVVVLVSDEASFVEAIGRWSEKSFFPVLFQEDLCAPRFIAAFKPARVIVLPPKEGAKPQQAADLFRGLLDSWSKSGEGKALPAQVDHAALMTALRNLSDDPQGVVVTQLSADEWPGALALAAGRFEGLELLPEGSDSETSKITSARARELARQVEQALTKWELPREGRACAVTMAGDFPLACLGAGTDDRLALQAVDDWIGRAADGGRLAFTGRLTNGRVASAYMAACSLFLQPESATLVDGGPPAAPGDSDHDLTAAGRILASRWKVERRTAQDPHTTPGLEPGTWRNGGFSYLQTGKGGWCADDVFAGDPGAWVFTQPGAANDPGHLETLCGRALLGGAYWCAGSIGDGGLESFPLAERSAGAIRDGVAWGAAFRRDDGQAFGWPGRVVICGDPLFCLRDDPAKRREYRLQDGPVVRSGEKALQAGDAGTESSPDAWRKRLQEARWRGDRDAARTLAGQAQPGADGPALAMVLEEQLRSGASIEAWRCWSKAEDEARRNLLASLFARQAACALMNSALAGGSLENALSAFDAFLLTGPDMDSAAHWLSRLARAAQSLDRLPVFSRWVAERATATDLNAYRKPFQDCARQIGQDALGTDQDGH